MKIFVTGTAGSGKTTLARRLGTVLDLPVSGLDGIVWQPGWHKTPGDRKAQLIAALIARPAWVIEGVSPTVLAAADMVIFLDIGRPRAFLRCAKRNWRYLFRSRPELPENCPEILIVPRLIRIIWNFPASVRPAILAAMKVHPGTARIVRRRADLSATLAELGIED